MFQGPKKKNVGDVVQHLIHGILVSNLEMTHGVYVLCSGNLLYFHREPLPVLQEILRLLIQLYQKKIPRPHRGTQNYEISLLIKLNQ